MYPRKVREELLKIDMPYIKQDRLLTLRSDNSQTSINKSRLRDKVNKWHLQGNKHLHKL